MSRNAGILLSVLLVLLIVFAGAYYYKYSHQVGQPAQSTFVPTTKPTIPFPKPSNARGNVTEFTDSTIVVKPASDSAMQTFSYTSTTGFYRITSGSLETNTATIVNATSSALRVGGEVLITSTEKDLTTAVTVLIIK